MITKLMITVAALAMPVSAMAQTDTVVADAKFVDSDVLVPICRRMAERVKDGQSSKDIVDSMGVAMANAGMDSDTRTVVFTVCTAYMAGRLDGMNDGRVI